MVIIEDYEKFLSHLEDIWNLSQKSKQMTLRNRFVEKDIRNTFFIQVSTILNDYYNGLLSPFLMIKLKDVFKINEVRRHFPIQKENQLISNLGFLTDLNYLKTWHDKQKLNLVFSIWIVFEDNIDILYKSIVTKEELDVYKNSTFNRIKSILEKTLSKEDLDEIKSKLSNEYIGLTNKYNYVITNLDSSIINNKSKKEMREFLDFLNSLRNTLHLNSRPLKNKSFNLEFGKFEFIKDTHIDFFTFEVLFKSIEKLIHIYEEIRNNLKSDDKIITPINF